MDIADTKEEDLTHPEDIEHFKHHEEEEVAAMKSEKEQQQTVVEANIPAKYKK